MLFYSDEEGVVVRTRTPQGDSPKPLFSWNQPYRLASLPPNAIPPILDVELSSSNFPAVSRNDEKIVKFTTHANLIYSFI